MKKYTILALILVLTASLFTGCRNKDGNPGDTSTPTAMPTVEMPTMDTTQAPTESTTEATVMPTTGSEPTGETNDGTTNTTDATETTNANDMARGRSRQRIPNGH